MRIRNREMSLSRLFRPNNDRSIVRNLVADRDSWEKIIQKPFTEVKKTKLVSLNQQIDSFAAKWGFKGLGVLWNPQFISDFLKLKEKESTQSAGQKVFVTIWIHPLLLSLRIAKYCPAIGYGGSDMAIMTKAVNTINDKIVVNDDFRNLEVIDDSFHQPEDDSDNPDNKEDEEIAENLPDMIEDLIVTEEVGMSRVDPLDHSTRSTSSLGRQNAFDHSDLDKPEDEPEDKPEDEPEESVVTKIEPKLERSSNECFDIRSLLCGYRHEVDPNVKAEDEEKPKITIIGFHPPTSLPAERPNQQLIQLPQPQPTQIGKLFADNPDEVAPAQLLLNSSRLVHESVMDNDGFTDVLDPEYLQQFSPNNSEVVPTVMSVVTIDTATITNAPRADRRRPENDSDISLPADLFDTSANDSGDVQPTLEDIDGPMTLREAIEERRAIQEAAEACYSESTPIGKHIRTFRRQFPQ